MATTNGYSTPLSLVQYLRLLKTVPNRESTYNYEEVGQANTSQTVFWLDNIGVIEGTYTLYYGASITASLTALTETTHYTIDLDTSKITLTTTVMTGGVTVVGNNKIFAVYKYNSEGLLNSDLLDALNQAENRVIRDTETTFTNTTALGYRKVVNELIKGHRNPHEKVFDFYYPPAINIQTTVNGAFTLGDVALTLTSSALLPSTGTIYVAGNKVAYTANAANVLTVPNTTPTIADGATVRGEVIEVSIEPEGNAQSYTVLTPDTEYEIDYDQGRVKILANAYFGEVNAEDRLYPTNYWIRVSYMHAWHEPNKDATIPDEIEYVVNALAARRIMGAIVAKAHTGGLNDFNPALINVDMDVIREILDEYRPLHVANSGFNKQSLS